MLLHYIKELKNRVILIICSWSINVLISYCYKETLLFFTIKFLSVEPLYFITTNVTEIITSYFYLSYFNSISVGHNCKKIVNHQIWYNF